MTAATKQCPTCKGRRFVNDDEVHGQTMPCFTCNGTGSAQEGVAETEATPSAIQGPWTIVEHSWAETSVIDKGASVVCLLSIESLATEENQTELEAIMAERARLIASAPDLLEAAKSALEALCIHDAQDGYAGDLLRAAIAKATKGA